MKSEMKTEPYLSAKEYQQWLTKFLAVAPDHALRHETESDAFLVSLSRMSLDNARRIMTLSHENYLQKTNIDEPQNEETT